MKRKERAAPPVAATVGWWCRYYERHPEDLAIMKAARRRRHLAFVARRDAAAEVAFIHGELLTGTDPTRTVRRLRGIADLLEGTTNA